jgi:hypothetical protein
MISFMSCHLIRLLTPVPFSHYLNHARSSEITSVIRSRLHSLYLTPPLSSGLPRIYTTPLHFTCQLGLELYPYLCIARPHIDQSKNSPPNALFYSNAFMSVSMSYPNAGDNKARIKMNTDAAPHCYYLATSISANLMLAHVHLRQSGRGR